jgi:hypothetical protein
VNENGLSNCMSRPSSSHSSWGLGPKVPKDWLLEMLAPPVIATRNNNRQTRSVALRFMGSPVLEWTEQLYANVICGSQAASQSTWSR